MTSERRKSILILCATLIVGVLIGLLVPGFFHKYQGGRQHGRGGRDMKGNERKKEWFAGTIYRVVKPDSVQAKQIKPIADWASQQIEAIEVSSNSQMSAVLDSVRVQLKPILTGEQQQRLVDFHNKANGRWKGDEDRRR